MRQKEFAQKKRKRKGRLSAAAAFVLLAAALAHPVCAADGEADAAGMSLQEALAGCSVTVKAPAGEEYQELADAGDVTLDFYRVASAKLQDDYFTLKWDPRFSEEEKNWNGILKQGEVTSADIEKLTQKLAANVLEKIPNYTDKAAEVDGTELVAAGAAISGIKFGEKVDLSSSSGPGMYLIVAHGNIREYKIRETENGPISTAAPGETKLFQFAPMLVTVPQKGEQTIGSIEMYAEDEKIEYPVGTGYTDGETDLDGGWENDIAIEPKVGFKNLKEETGSLKITKTLNTHEVVDFGGRKDPATFVFEVVVTGKDGGEVYNNVISMVFEEAGGPQEKVISGLPVGAKADVTEVYKGNYETAEGTPARYEGIEIKADKVSSITDENGEEQEVRETQTDVAAFTNDYSETWRGGGSVTNTYDSEMKTQKDGSEEPEWSLSDVGQNYAQENGQ